MSMESAKTFIERMKTDEDFSKKVNDCKDFKERKEFVVSAGYDFTMEELNGVIPMELCEEEIAEVAGGQCLSFDLYGVSERVVHCTMFH